MIAYRSFAAGMLAGIAAASAFGGSTAGAFGATTTGAGGPVEPLRPVAVTLHRFDMVPGREAAFAEWMAMLHDRHREAVATLARERTYMEAMFTASDEPRRLYWLTVQGAGGFSAENSTLDLDRRHEAYMAAVLAKGSHARLATRSVLAPDFAVAAVRGEQARER